ncbi:uncharacterized protein LOC125239297 [Leguminivora glycinivorella]|uniref:uncharacterized protein LOC125239297 n=1 Tax=Leguminivora glycinivorella TaxID=1035111 RepID=UPI00200F0A4C|nr:uncharacterized protein LOC125239297 [Leguminivora glycinivorella]
MSMAEMSNLVSFNCKCLKRSLDGVRELCKEGDIIALQETWLLPHDLPLLGTIHEDFAYTGSSAVDTGAGLLTGRPHGGVALLWRKSAFSEVTVVECENVRLVAIKVKVRESSFLVFSVYMPVNAPENVPLFTECLGEISAISEDNTDVEAIYVLGDFNAHPNELFYNELLQFCETQVWRCVDLEMLGSDSGTFTFTSEAHGCNRWLDHCVVTEAARQTVCNVRVKYDAYWSDHLPLIIECKLNKIQIKCSSGRLRNEGVRWGERQPSQIELYQALCNDRLKMLDFPAELTPCADKLCMDRNHSVILDKMYDDIIDTLTEAARKSSRRGHSKRKVVVGWNKHVASALRGSATHMSDVI